MTDGVQRIWMSEPLDTRIHVAQTARCESHSRLLAMLKEAERGCVERQCDDRAHDDRCFPSGEDRGKHGRDDETDQSEYQATSPLPGAYVGDARGHGGEDSCRSGVAPLGQVRRGEFMAGSGNMNNGCRVRVSGGIWPVHLIRCRLYSVHTEEQWRRLFPRPRSNMSSAWF